MKTRKLLFVTLLLLCGISTHAQTCNDDDNVIAFIGNDQFEATTAQAYYWEIIDGTDHVEIDGSNTGKTIGVTCLSVGEFTIKVTRFVDGTCIEACETYKCVSTGGGGGGDNIVPIGSTTLCDTVYQLFVHQEYDDGTYSSGNTVSVVAGGNFPPGTLYKWTIERMNGSVEHYGNSTQNPRHFNATINNRIVKATVTATYINCVQTASVTFLCPIPDIGLDGNLLPDCNNGLPGGGGPGEGRSMMNISVFPNPTTSTVSFTGEKIEQYQISIYDMYGNTVIKGARLSREINLKKQKPGTYIYVITDGKGYHQKGRIVKK